MKKSKVSTLLLVVTLMISTVIGCEKKTEEEPKKEPEVVVDEVEKEPEVVVDEVEKEPEVVVENATYKVATYKLVNPDSSPVELEISYTEVEVEKDNLSELVKATYEAAKTNSNNYLKEASAVTKVEQKDGITYVTLNDEFSKDWKGGTFYECVVFDTMTASFCSIDGVDKVVYKLEGEDPGLHMDLEGTEFSSDYLEDNYKIVEPGEKAKTEVYEISTYKLIDPNTSPLELEVKSTAVEVEKDNLLELVKATYEAEKTHSSDFLKEASAVTNVEQKDGITYVTLNDEFSKDWKGGTFYECIVFDVMTASFCSIDGVDKVMYKLEGEDPGLHIGLEEMVYTTDYLEESYNLVTK